MQPAWSGSGANDAKRPLEELDKLTKKADGPLPQNDIDYYLNVLDHLLGAEYAYAHDVDELKKSDSPSIGEPIQQFIRLEKMRPTASPPDRELTFAAAPVGSLPADGKRRDVALPVWLTADAEPVVFVANAQEVRRADGNGPALTFPGGKNNVPPTANGVLPIDWTNDFRTSLILAGAGGLRFYRQEPNGQFTDVTDKTGLDEKTRTTDYFGAWAADYEMDGDLDVILAPRSGEVVVLRNNGNGKFKVVTPFPEVKGALRLCLGRFRQRRRSGCGFP